MTVTTNEKWGNNYTGNSFIEIQHLGTIYSSKVHIEMANIVVKLH